MDGENSHFQLANGCNSGFSDPLRSLWTAAIAAFFVHLLRRKRFAVACSLEGVEFELSGDFLNGQ